MDDARYEDRFGSVARVFRRVIRALRWTVRGMLRRPRTVLVELRWRLGDEIMALPVLDALARDHPGVGIHVLTNFPELYEGYPVVAAEKTLPLRVDRYIFLRDGPRTVYRAARYARRAGVPTPDAPPALRFTNWDAPQLAGLKRPIIALARGASWPTKRWPLDRWNALSARLRRAGHTVVAMGLEGESMEADVDLAGRTGIREAVCVLHHADLLVCCDSGLMHLALAAGTPVVALFGPTDPEWYVRNQPLFHPLRSPADCAGCWNHGPEAPSPGQCPLDHAVCLEAIGVDAVLDAARAQLGKAG